MRPTTPAASIAQQHRECRRGVSGEQAQTQEHHHPRTDKGDSEEPVGSIQRQRVRKDDEDEIPLTVSEDSCAAAEQEKSEELPSPRRSGDETATRATDRRNDNSNDEDADDVILSPMESVMRQNVNSTVRWTMTGAALLFVLAGFLTILVASQYRFFLACVWATLLFLLVGFVWFVQQTVICSNTRRSRRVFHPAVHAVADWVQQRVQDLRDDVRACYDEVLLLSNEPEYDSYRESSYWESQSSDNKNSKNPRGTVGDGRKPKSALFRVFVQPALGVLFRGRRKRRQKRAQREAAPSVSSYVPPSSDNISDFKETELV